MEWLLDLHLGNVGRAFPTLDDNPVKNIPDYFGNLKFLLRNDHRTPQSLPTYFVPPIWISEYMTHTDPTLHEAPLQAVIMDLGNGQ